MTQAILPHLPTVDGLSDADAAAQLSTEVLTPWPENVTWSSLANAWGLARAIEVRAGLDAMAGGQNAQMKAAANYAIAVLGGKGFVPGHPQATAAVAMFVAAGLCTSQEAKDLQYRVSYPCGEPVTAEQVAEARALRSREDAVREAQAVLNAARNAGAVAVDGADPIDKQVVRAAVLGVLDAWAGEG